MKPIIVAGICILLAGSAVCTSYAETEEEKTIRIAKEISRNRKELPNMRPSFRQFVFLCRTNGVQFTSIGTYGDPEGLKPEGIEEMLNLSGTVGKETFSIFVASMLSNKHLKRARSGNMKGNTFAVNGLLVLGFDEEEPPTKVAKAKILKLFASYKYEKPEHKKE